MVAWSHYSLSLSDPRSLHVGIAHKNGKVTVKLPANRGLVFLKISTILVCEWTTSSSSFIYDDLVSQCDCLFYDKSYLPRLAENPELGTSHEYLNLLHLLFRLRY